MHPFSCTDFLHLMNRLENIISRANDQTVPIQISIKFHHFRSGLCHIRHSITNEMKYLTKLAAKLWLRLKETHR